MAETEVRKETEIKKTEVKKQSCLNSLFCEVKWVLVWVIAFAVIGIIIQSRRAGGLVFIDFFGGNLVEWIKSFSNFTSAIEVSSYSQIFEMMLRDWYYFLYAGGLISLVWGIICSLFKSFRREKIEITQQKTINELEERFVQGQQS